MPTISVKDKPLQVSTIQQALQSANVSQVKLAGVNACSKPHLDILEPTLQLWASSPNPYERLAALAYGTHLPAYVRRLLAIDLIESNVSDVVTCLAWQYCHVGLPAAFVEERARGEDYDVVCAIADYVRRHQHLASKAQIRAWLDDEDWRIQFLGMSATDGRQYIPLNWIGDGLAAADSDVQDAAIASARQRQITPATLNRWWNAAPDDYYRMALLEVCQGRLDARSIIVQGLDFADADVREAAAAACRGVIFPLDQLKKWYYSERTAYESAALYASIGRTDVPSEWIEYLTARERREDHRLSFETRLACYGRSDLSPLRDYEPAKGEVQIHCLGDVIVDASIPPDATIRQITPRRFSTDKISVVRIHGYFCGEKVGLPTWDFVEPLRARRSYAVSDFDPTDGENGFEFSPEGGK